MLPLTVCSYKKLAISERKLSTNTKLDTKHKASFKPLNHILVGAVSTSFSVFVRHCFGLKAIIRGCPSFKFFGL